MKKEQAWKKNAVQSIYVAVQLWERESERAWKCMLRVRPMRNLNETTNNNNKKHNERISLYLYVYRAAMSSAAAVDDDREIMPNSNSDSYDNAGQGINRFSGDNSRRAIEIN